jgi:hypothetical protein
VVGVGVTVGVGVWVDVGVGVSVWVGVGLMVGVGVWVGVDVGVGVRVGVAVGVWVGVPKASGWAAIGEAPSARSTATPRIRATPMMAVAWTTPELSDILLVALGRIRAQGRGTNHG